MDTTKLWESVLSDLQTQLARPNFVTLFKNTTIVSLENNHVVIGARSHMAMDLLQKKFLSQIQELLEKHSKKPLSVSIISKGILAKAQTPEHSGPLFTTVSDKAPGLSVGHLPRVRPDYTFQNFAVSTSNQLAFVSSQAVAKNIGHSYNPFFIYGPVGVGKTHLMHAIANDAYQKQPDKKIIYITSEEFTNEVVEAIRTNDTARMKKKFRSAYVLLIDDIQFIAGKEKVQEELFHTFNILIDQGSQICLSSDRPPQEIKKLEKRLSSRFAGGLTVDIEPPDLELKIAILLIKAKKYGYELPMNVAEFIAGKAQDTRSLEGLLLRVITQATNNNQPITEELAKKSFGQALEEKRGHIHAEDIIDQVCSFYRVKSTQLKGPKRDASLVRARHVAMYLLKKELELPYVEIGNILGGRDHTTIMHGVEKMEITVANKALPSGDIIGISKLLHE